MKNNITITLGTFLLFILLTINTPALAGGGAPPPPPPPQHGEGGNVPGGGAPVGEGLILLVALGAAYGYKKWKASDNKEA